MIWGETGCSEGRWRGGLGLLLALAACLMGLMSTPKVWAAPTPTPGGGGLSLPGAGAVDKGLAYLVRMQAHDGAWRSQGTMGSYPTVMTSLAGLALMASGSTPMEGPYAPNIRRAVDFILASANPSGLIARPSEASHSMYGHGFSMLFLAEAYGMERDRRTRQRIHDVLVKAVALTGESQSDWGGWLYTPDSKGDEGSVTVTQIQALRAVRNMGIRVPRSIIDKAVQYIEKSANPDGGIRYTARNKGPSRPAISAAAVATLYNAGQYDSRVAEDCLRYISHLLAAHHNNMTATFQGFAFYAMMYASQAMYLNGEKTWQSFFPEVRDELIRAQRPDGSWNGDNIGLIYGTSIALLTLQLPKGYLPILQR